MNEKTEGAGDAERVSLHARSLVDGILRRGSRAKAIARLRNGEPGSTWPSTDSIASITLAEREEANRHAATFSSGSDSTAAVNHSGPSPPVMTLLTLQSRLSFGTGFARESASRKEKGVH